jgi:hypothetical protein
MAMLGHRPPFSFRQSFPGLSLASIQTSARIAVLGGGEPVRLTVSAVPRRHETVMSQGKLASSKQFVPSGVDAQSWIGFEQRIQERRFKALIDAINAAIATRDGVAARAALEEARELRPAAPELDTLTARVALLPAGTQAAGSAAFLWYRGLGAVAMFVVGIGLVIGIESFRSDAGPAAPVEVVASVAPPTAAATPNQTAAPLPIAPSASPVTDSAVSDVPPATAAPVVAPTREEPVGTAGVPRAPRTGVVAADAPNRATFRPVAPDVVEPAVSTSREIPDDYIAPSPRSEARAGYTEAAATGPAFAANVIPQPVSITAPPPPAPTLPATTSAVATASTVAPRGDDSRVAQVLNQYARAYDRLDPSAARAVWPTVDERALARAFASLESQDVSFNSCDIDVKGTQASAFCRGTASYVGKIGSRQARTESRQWNFELKLHGDDWKIEKAQVSR